MSKLLDILLASLVVLLAVVLTLIPLIGFAVRIVM